MKPKVSHRRNIFILVISAALIIIFIFGLFYKLQNSKKPTEAVNINSTQETPDAANNTSAPEVTNQGTTSATSTTQAAPVSVPKQPSFTKSSGNNGPVPSGVSINFICNAEPGVDCSIILVSGGKQTSIGPTKVTDNGRGQYFASFYWTSVKGSYKVTAQAKNSQGGVSSSITQALEVQ